MYNKKIDIFKSGKLNEISVKNHENEAISNLYLVNESFLHEKEEIIDLLHTWREKNKQWYLTEFKYDRKKTRHWINDELIGSKSRIFFFIGQDKNSLVGHIGLRDITKIDAEFDNPMNGENYANKGLMTYCGVQLADMAFKILGLKYLYVNIFDHNEKSIGLHKRIGFQFCSKTYLKKTVDNDGYIKYVPCVEEESNIDFTYNKYFLDEDRFYVLNQHMINFSYDSLIGRQ